MVFQRLPNNCVLDSMLVADVENPCNAHTLLPSPGVLCYRDMGELLCMCQDESMALWTGNESTELKLSVSGVETQMKCSVTSQSQRTYELNKVVECRPCKQGSGEGTEGEFVIEEESFFCYSNPSLHDIVFSMGLTPLFLQWPSGLHSWHALATHSIGKAF